MSLNKSIVFLAGWPFNADVFSPIAEYLSDHSCHLINLPILEKVTHQNLINFLDKQMPANTIIVGWSLGGLIASLYTSQRQDKIEKLILINSTPRFTGSDNWAGISQDLVERFKMRTNTIDKLSNYFLKLTCWPNRDKALIQHLKRHLWSNQKQIASYLDFLFECDIRDKFANINIPKLDIRSLDDAIIPTNNDQFERDYLINGGHASFLAQPAQIISYMQNFIYAN